METNLVYSPLIATHFVIPFAVKIPFRTPAKFLSLSLLLVTAALAAPDREFKTTPVMKLETRTLVQLLEVYHYNKDGVTPADFPQLIGDYMKEGLDPQRLFFTAEDETAFRNQYGPRIETDLAWLGMVWDEKYSQSARFPLYREAMERLQAAGR